jgi:hypothetical protein
MLGWNNEYRMRGGSGSLFFSFVFVVVRIPDISEPASDPAIWGMAAGEPGGDTGSTSLMVGDFVDVSSELIEILEAKGESGHRNDFS